MFEGKIGRRKNRIAVRIEREVVRQREGDRS
jgi:flagellar motor switch protein FliM